MSLSNSVRDSQLQGRTRPRNERGCFISSVTSRRSEDSLSGQKRRQNEYATRRLVVQKRILNSFVRSFVVMDQDKEHWIPGSMENNPFQDLFQALVKDAFRGSKQGRLSAMKTIYHRGDPRKQRDILPRRRVRAADQPQAEQKRLSVFSGSRFPIPIDDSEMEKVHHWLQDNKSYLNMSVENYIGETLKTFSLYVKRGSTYRYSGFPLSNANNEQEQENDEDSRLAAPQMQITPAQAVPTAHPPASPPVATQERTDHIPSSQTPATQINLHSPVLGAHCSDTNVDNSAGELQSNLDSQPMLTVTRHMVPDTLADNREPRSPEHVSETTTLSLQQHAIEDRRGSTLRAFTKSIIELAFDDVIYRAFKLAVQPPCQVRLAVVCALWVSSFREGPLPEWRGLQKYFYDYCRFTVLGKTESDSYRTAKQCLVDQFELFKLLRQNENMPLFEEDSWGDFNST